MQKSTRRFALALALAVAGLCLESTGRAAFASDANDASDSDDTASLEARAVEAFGASDWPRARKLYRELSLAKAEDAAVWFRLGLSTLNSEGTPGAAIEAYERALELGYRPGPALVGIARAHATASDGAAVVETLHRLAELGPSRGAVRQLESNPAFDAVRSDEAFQAVVRQLTPCSADEYRQFDFWLGDWEVQNPQGLVVGTNSITESLDGCLLLEAWESASGNKGLSINYYDHAGQTWTQTYRDNTGNIGNWPDLEGTFRDGSMVLESPADAEPRSRWTWTRISDDKVRQMAESSSDGGKTWTVTWDSYYLRQ